MNRGGFLKSLFTLAVAPKVILEISEKLATKNILTVGSGITRSLISNLQLLTPEYYKKYVEKYGQESYVLWNEWISGSYENLSLNTEVKIENK